MMWSPTHVQVTVQRSKDLITKGKNGTNDAFVTIGLGKEKFQTSVIEKAESTVEWHEKCELQIPKQGNRAVIVLTALHRSFIGIDEFLGCVHVPLADMDVYERPKNRWYKLMDKNGKESKKERGELEVKISFIVKAGSLSDLSKKGKHKSSLGQLSQAFGGSLISISSLDKRKGLKKLTSKLGKFGKSSKKDMEIPQIFSPDDPKPPEEPDPGVISEVESDDEFALDELSQKGSVSSLNYATSTSTSTRSSENVSALRDPVPAPREFLSPVKPPPTLITPEIVAQSNKPISVKEPVNWRSSALLPSSLSSTREDEQTVSSNLSEPVGKMTLERMIVGREMPRSPSPKAVHLSKEALQKYSGKSKEELVEIILQLQNQIVAHEKHREDLEDYIDNLLLRVMENSPRILQNPFINCKAQAHMY